MYRRDFFKKGFIQAILVLLCTYFIGINFSAAQPPLDLPYAKEKLLHYYVSGLYAHDLIEAIHPAYAYLDKRASENARNNISSKKLALVFDIDETVLSNFQNMEALSFGGSLSEIRQQLLRGRDPAIEASYRLYQYALTKGISVFFVTGRDEGLRMATIRNLSQAGFGRYQELFMRPNHFHGKSAAEFKTALREKITREGYEIVLNIGDQMSDLSGGFAEKAIKLPNPYYFIA